MKKITIDAKIIKKIKNGDNETIIRVYDYYREKVERYLVNRFPRQKHDVEDNVSDILMKVFENIDKYKKDKSNFNTWVISIAKNHMLDINKKKKPVYTSFSTTSGDLIFDSLSTTNNKNTYDSDWSYGTITTNHCTTHNVFTVSSENQLCASTTVSKIKFETGPSDYSMLTMKYIDGYSYDDIGKEFNITKEEACNRVNYVKNKLNKKIKGK